MDQELYMGKLDSLHRVKTKTEDLDSLSVLLKEELQAAHTEEENLKEYRKELEQLAAEKLHHVEQLRQIHSDISMIENIVKQGQEALKHSESRSRLLYKDYLPLKKEINDLRVELGLEELNEDSELSSLRQVTSQHNARAPRKKSTNGNVHTSVSLSSPSSSHQRSQKRQHDDTGQDDIATGFTVKSTVPPMKQCVSCHQFIHRNAPICPLCKAKSRSRNYKRGKK